MEQILWINFLGNGIKICYPHWWTWSVVWGSLNVLDSWVFGWGVVWGVAVERWEVWTCGRGQSWGIIKRKEWIVIGREWFWFFILKAGIEFNEDGQCEFCESNSTEYLSRRWQLKSASYEKNKS